MPHTHTHSKNHTLGNRQKHAFCGYSLLGRIVIVSAHHEGKNKHAPRESKLRRRSLATCSKLRSIVGLCWFECRFSSFTFVCLQFKKLFQFQVRESLAPLNVPTPTPASDHPLQGCDWGLCEEHKTINWAGGTFLKKANFLILCRPKLMHKVQGCPGMASLIQLALQNVWGRGLCQRSAWFWKEMGGWVAPE